MHAPGTCSHQAACCWGAQMPCPASALTARAAEALWSCHVLPKKHQEGHALLHCCESYFQCLAYPSTTECHSERSLSVPARLTPQPHGPHLM